MASPNRGEYCVSKAGLSMAARLRRAARGPASRFTSAGHHRDRHDRRCVPRRPSAGIADGVPERRRGQLTMWTRGARWCGVPCHRGRDQRDGGGAVPRLVNRDDKRVLQEGKKDDDDHAELAEKQIFASARSAGSALYVVTRRTTRPPPRVTSADRASGRTRGPGIH
jgi:hypothetical protein